MTRPIAAAKAKDIEKTSEATINENKEKEKYGLRLLAKTTNATIQNRNWRTKKYEVKRWLWELQRLEIKLKNKKKHAVTRHVTMKVRTNLNGNKKQSNMWFEYIRQWEQINMYLEGNRQRELQAIAGVRTCKKWKMKNSRVSRSVKVSFRKRQWKTKNCANRRQATRRIRMSLKWKWRSKKYYDRRTIPSQSSTTTNSDAKPSKNLQRCCLLRKC